MSGLLDTVAPPPATGGVRRAYPRKRCLVMGAAVVALFVTSLAVGHTLVPLAEVVRVVLGDDTSSAAFVVGTLRLPRAVLAVLAGAAFGAAGVTFQTMLRNPLASPDVIGISSGASAAAVVGLLVLRLDRPSVAMLAIVAALATAALIYGLAFRDGLLGVRLILIGIGIAAMLDAVVASVILQAASWDLPVAMRWLTGSLNAAGWADVTPLAASMAVALPLLVICSRDLQALRFGDDTATALGVHPGRTRVRSMCLAVVLLAFATAAAGPVAFVAFLSGPIAARIVGSGRALVVPAALVGALLVAGADLLGQFAFGSRYPVGVVTGALGAPYLVYLLIRSNRTGASI